MNAYYDFSTGGFTLYGSGAGDTIDVIFAGGSAFSFDATGSFTFAYGRISGVSGRLRGARVTAQAPKSRKFTLTKDGADVVGSSGTLARGASTVKGAGSRRAGGWEAASGAGCPTCGRKATWS